MSIAHAIEAVKMAGGNVTSQSIADLATQVWNDIKRAERSGDIKAQSELEAEFAALCKAFEGI
jgi:hypothetical protein